jgi:hypothetical protein
MKTFLILFLFLARFATADAKILEFKWWPAARTVDGTVAGTPYRFRISWETQSEPGHYHQHSRTFDMKGGSLSTGITVLQSDD